MTTPARQTPRPSLLDQIAQPGMQLLPLVVAVATPAVGAQWTFNIPPGVVWRIQALRASYNTSAVVATRAPRLSISDGTNVIARISTGSTTAASSTVTNQYLAGFGATNIIDGGFGQLLPWPDIPLIGGWSIASSVLNGDAGDSWTAIVIYALELRPPLPGQVAGLDVPPATPAPEV